MEHHELLDAALGAARTAAEFIRTTPRPDGPDEWDHKGRNDFVTDVDRGAEERITAHLLGRFPDSIVLGEELNPNAATDDLLWIVDPLDGTTNYLHDYPWYAVSIAALAEGDLAAAVVVNVATRDEYTALRAAGAQVNGSRIRVSSVTDPSTALLGTGFPFKAPDLLPGYLREFDRLMTLTSGIRRAGSAALDLTDVARGRFDGFWESQLAPWDVAAGTLIVREAGGVVTNLHGSGDVVAHGSIVAGNPSMHAWLLETLAS